MPGGGAGDGVREIGRLSGSDTTGGGDVLRLLIAIQPAEERIMVMPIKERKEGTVWKTRNSRMTAKKIWK